MFLHTHQIKMKTSHMLLFFGLFFLGLLQNSCSKGFDKTYPMYNVNLPPFIQRLSAYYCLKNETPACPGNFTLKVSGWLNISKSDTDGFCSGGCKEHTQQVLKCIWYVDQDYRFENKASIKNLNDTINIGCAQGFNGTSINKGSGTTASIITTLSALTFLAVFYM